MKILLHTCCAPCLIYPYAQMSKKGVKASGFFYNPNIYPNQEYQFRRQALIALSGKQNIDIIYAEYNPREYFTAIQNKESSPERCAICWSIRLKRTASAAKENGFDMFTTTLLVSPYQDQDTIKEIGNKIAREEKIGFYYEDFRPGFKTAYAQAKQDGLYCQQYCGCMYSNEAWIYRTK
ncbi:MAG: epoxyqueuosine reductase QueH [Candidatus Omnitrophota bacterium]